MNSSKLKASQHVFEKFDIAHVCEKFPSAPRLVSETLGKAISRRREYFKYRESHHRKLSEGILAENAERPTHDNRQDADGDARTEVRPLSTVASSIPQEFNIDEHVLALEAEQLSDSGETQTSIATSAADSQTRKIPPVPKAADDGNPFPCPYCFMLITVRSRYSWKKYVLKDLQPYACTFPSCLNSKRLFERRHEWFQHEMQYHRWRWICKSGCEITFESKGGFEEHLIDTHGISKDSERLNHLVQSCEKRPSLGLEISCVLCGEILKLKQLERHLGKHQKHLTLFALPSVPDQDTDDAGDDISDMAHSALAEHTVQGANSEDSESDTDDGEPLRSENDRAIEEVYDNLHPRSAAPEEVKETREEAQKRREDQLQASHKGIVEGVSTAAATLGKKRPALKFKDALGRNFLFPWHLCCTWKVGHPSLLVKRHESLPVGLKDVSSWDFRVWKN